MPVDIASIDFSSPFNSPSAKNLLGNIGSRRAVTIDFFVHWETLATDIVFNSTLDYAERQDSGSFLLDGFRDGDTITITGTSNNNGNFTITQVTDKRIYTAAFTTEASVNCNIYGTTSINGIKFLYNLVENNEGVDFNSRLDGELQKYENRNISTTPTTDTLNPATANKSWLTGESAIPSTITSLGVGTGTPIVSGGTGYEKAFRVVHYFYVAPVYKEDYDDADGIMSKQLIPDLANGNSYKYVYRIEAADNSYNYRFATDDGNIQYYTPQGSVGWFDENFNGNDCPYEIRSISYQDVSSGDAQTSLTEQSTRVTISVGVKAGETATFSSSRTQYDFYFWRKRPSSEYANNANLMWENFDVENFYGTLGQAVNTRRTDKISSITVTAQTSTLFQISFVYGANDYEDGYFMHLNLQGAFFASSFVASDQSNLLVDENTFQAYGASFPVAVSNLRLLDHPNDNPNLGYTGGAGWVEDDYLLVADVYGDTPTITVKIEVVNLTDETRNFTLEETEIAAGTDTVRDFKSYGDPDKLLVKLAEVVANTQYLLEYGFKIRWEYWLNQPNVDSEFITATRNWNNYQASGWRTDIAIYYGDVKIASTYLSILNYDEVADCNIAAEIETYHAVTSDNLNGSIARTANTLVRAIFTDTDSECFVTEESGSGSGSGSAIAANEFFGWIGFDKEITGGLNFIDKISTEFDKAAGTIWIGGSGNKCKITQFLSASPPRIELEATIDYTLIDLTQGEYKLSARLGCKPEANVCLDGALIDDIGHLIIFENEDFEGYSGKEATAVFFMDGEDLLSQGGEFLAEFFLPPDYLSNTFLSGTYKCACWLDIIIGEVVSNTFTSDDISGYNINNIIILADGQEQSTIEGASILAGEFTFGGDIPDGTEVRVLDGMSVLDFGTLANQNEIISGAFVGKTVDQLLVFIDGEEISQHKIWQNMIPYDSGLIVPYSDGNFYPFKPGDWGYVGNCALVSNAVVKSVGSSGSFHYLPEIIVNGGDYIVSFTCEINAGDIDVFTRNTTGSPSNVKATVTTSGRHQVRFTGTALETQLRFVGSLSADDWTISNIRVEKIIDGVTLAGSTLSLGFTASGKYKIAQLT